MKKLNKLISDLEYKDKSLEADYKNTVTVSNTLKTVREIKEEQELLINELFGLWDALAVAGEISIGKEFSKNYNRLEKIVKGK